MNGGRFKRILIWEGGGKPSRGGWDWGLLCLRVLEATGVDRNSEGKPAPFLPTAWGSCSGGSPTR